MIRITKSSKSPILEKFWFLEKSLVLQSDYSPADKKRYLEELFIRAGKVQKSREQLAKEAERINNDSNFSAEKKMQLITDLYKLSGTWNPHLREKDPNFALLLQLIEEVLVKTSNIKKDKAMIDTMNKDIKALEEKLMSDKNALVLLQSQYNNLIIERDKIQEEKIKLINEKASIEDNLKSAETERDLKNSQIEKIIAENSALSVLLTQHDKLRKEKSILEEKLARNDGSQANDLNDEKASLDAKLLIIENDIKDRNPQVFMLIESIKATDSTTKHLKNSKDNVDSKMGLIENQVQACNEKLIDYDKKKSDVENLTSEVNVKNSKIKDDQQKISDLMLQLSMKKKELADLQQTLNSIVETHRIESNKLKKELGLQTESSLADAKNKPPRLEFSMKDKKISIIRGWLNSVKLIPKFHDSSFINALGFINDPSDKLITEAKVTADRTADLNARSSLMLVYSDIVAPHFVGNSLSRVLRILPLRRGQRHEIVHERFVKPLSCKNKSN